MNFTFLVIDSGNSFVKWGLFNNDHWLTQNSISYDDVSDLEIEFSVFSEPYLIIISHVARDETKNEICKFISRWPTQPIWHHSQSYQCGVSNGYSNPNQLGSDRWAALIAAWNIEHKACLVINAGTAVTIDTLSDSGKFLGGIILPGVHLMLNSLYSGTQLERNKSGVYKNFPVNTQNAILSGIIQSLVGAIDRMHDILSAQLKHSSINCIISGGNASLLSPFIRYPTKIIDNLVLEGLVVIAKDELKRRELTSS
ncbi:MAG: type III pantothenate kinase [Nitrosomonas sp.]|uniref:type III pantothenate kinase n=1 Tax=Nitrosomonas sp. TaxID=42353 RepID=UPI0025FF5163|nr:type III pantothenate kinase [Nitrosomonas sp.]UJP03416.1 MAG: type III pantothenate kinase [Nitrosomonas sp.]